MLVASVSIFLSVTMLAPVTTLKVVAGIGTMFFGVIVFLRVIACINLLAQLPVSLFQRQPRRTPDADLPVYSILVPLYDEAKVIEGLVTALKQLDYPGDKLDIKLIFESDDTETLAAAQNLQLPRHFQKVIVPNSQPRTKPKALNYALQMARGDYVVVYDAEDRPDPDQLRKALAAFSSGPANLACLQARLTIYNGAENWLTKQFAIEYGALFRGLLPTHQAIGLPIPLGGTSNHFRMPALRWLGAWDAFNVTEDADLGMRLYKHGYICHMLDSETGEEAPNTLKSWFFQRTRWLKGWMQTWLVHTRRPVQLWNKLGTGRFLAFHLITAGMIFSILAHPIFWLLIGLKLSDDSFLAAPTDIVGVHLWVFALFNVAVGFIASMLISLIALRQTGARYAFQILLLPAYWLLMSFAGYRAVAQLVTNPFHWEKTQHGVSKFVEPAQTKPPA